ncbi:MAG: hypothetical protein SFY66_24565 [Oculatellaceae cyanobacterium bins.114]|nr:hypothetical protein [Oculatellaceae cyanobacterium bins.114]
MSRSWRRLLKSTYRREPISSFILTVGLVDAVIGGVGDRWSLMTVGIGIVGVAIALRVLKSRQPIEEAPTRAPIHYLPARTSSPSLPMLTLSRKRPSN